MNETENNPNLLPHSADNEEVQALRRQVTLLFGALIITSFTLTAFLGLQMRRASAELMAIRPQAEETFRLAQQDSSGAQAVFGKLTEFARTHPDFQKQVLSKYKISGNSLPATPSK